MGRARATVVVLCTAAVACKSGKALPPIDDGPVARACPKYLDMELLGYPSSRFLPGWSGNAHGIGPAKGSTLAVAITGCDSECRRCSFHGPIRSPTQPVVSQRCLDNVAMTCTQDGDCGTAGPCRFMFPPMPATGSLLTCSIAYFEPVAGADPSPIQGVVDLVTGETDEPVLNLYVATTVPNQNAGISCAACTGDPTANDGVAGGTCQGSNLKCDANGIGEVIPITTSFDCAPAPHQLTISLASRDTSTASHSWKLDPTRPKCNAGSHAGGRCWCGVCTNGEPCFEDAQCATGTCGSAGPGSATYQLANNGCTGTCNWNANTQSGTCSDTPTKSCFPDSGEMTAVGGAQVMDGYYIAQLANLQCMPSFIAGCSGVACFVDAIGGFPGPLLFQSTFRVTPRMGP